MLEIHLETKDNPENLLEKVKISDENRKKEDPILKESTKTFKKSDSLETLAEIPSAKKGNPSHMNYNC